MKIIDRSRRPSREIGCAPSESHLPTPFVNLRLSVEHAAIAAGMSDADLRLTIMLGLAWSDTRIAGVLHTSRHAIEGRIRALRQKTRMTRLGLAVMGYYLLGDHDREDLKSAA